MHDGYVYDVCISPDDKYIVSGSDDKFIKIWDIKSMKQIKGDGEMLKKQASNIYSVCFSPNGKYLVSGAADGKITLWNFNNREIEGQPLIGHTALVWRVRFSNDGNKLVSASNDKTLMIWSVQTRKCLGKLTGHTGYVRNGFFFDNNRMIASSSDVGEYSVRIWDAENYE